MSGSADFLSPAEAARALGVSAKALRVYEEHGLMAPGRTQAGWRAYGPADMARGRQVVALRALGLSLAEIARVLAGKAGEGLEHALAAHQASLEGRLRDLTTAIGQVRDLRRRAANGARPGATEIAELQPSETETVATVDLPWPWGGERFDLLRPAQITYLTGPLFSGKTRLAMLIANTLPGGAFIGLDRAADGAATARAELDGDEALRGRCERTLAWLADDGATVSDALLALVAALEAAGPGVLVVDLVEQGIDEASQLALIAHLRRRGGDARPLFLMTRSNAILDLASVRTDESILLCSANHAPPMYVAAYPGAPGYETVASCLSPPDVRARTEGVVAMRSPAA
ncbi:MAG: MerR family transcriptional regulator [Alphaproteobacteria bacterium 32-64-14]|nr:MAG: MerR family transcriptional regulator [Alphaproteobacteria bacterium 32-64-14]